MSHSSCGRLLLAVLIILAFQWAPSTEAQSPIVPPSSLRNVDVSQSLVALISFATAPGVTNATYSIDWPSDQPKADLDKWALEIEPEINLRGKYFRIFTGLGFSYITLNDKLKTENEDGEPVTIDPDRELLSARVSGGLAFDVTPHFEVTPYFSVIYSEIDSETSVSGNVDLDNIDPALRIYLLDFSTKSYSLAGTLKLKYDRWFGKGRIEAYGLYTYTYTDTFDESKSFIKSSGDVNVLDFEARWTAPTGLQLYGVPLRWKVFGGYTDFLDLRKEDLGFTYFFEFGGGFDFEVDVRTLGLFNLRNVGFEMSGIMGNNITGWSIGIIFRN